MTQRHKLIHFCGRKSTALFTTHALVAVTNRVFILFRIVYPCGCYYAILALLSRKSQEIARTMLLFSASQHALSDTCYAVETGANFLESFSPFLKFRTNISFVCNKSLREDTLYICIRVNTNPNNTGAILYSTCFGIKKFRILRACLYLFLMTL
jgi:hypothetical protein